MVEREALKTNEIVIPFTIEDRDAIRDTRAVVGRLELLWNDWAHATDGRLSVVEGRVEANEKRLIFQTPEEAEKVRWDAITRNRRVQFWLMFVPGLVGSVITGVFWLLAHLFKLL